MKVYEWVDANGRGVVTNWPKLQKAQKDRLEMKFDKLVHAEVDSKTRQANLPPEMLAGPGYGGEPFIYKLKARSNVQLRPMLCLGPFDASDWTILYPSQEKSGKLIPPNAPQLAEVRRKEILKDRNRRRLLVDDGQP
jgi:hypothetical protein